LTARERVPADRLAELARGWPTSLYGRLNAIFADRLESTQTLARRLLERHFDEDECPTAFVVVALEQSGGRGRQGRRWASAPGLGVWASIALPVTGPESLQALPMRSAVALAELVNELLHDGCRLKWPNDLVIGRRKLGGLLVDALARPDGSGWAIVGFGVNRSHLERDLPETRAISLTLASRAALPPLGELSGRAVAAVFSELESEHAWLERYRALSAHQPGDALECEVGGRRLAGRFAGFDARGFLCLETAAGIETISSGEVFSW
jgi:BirA family biotin operon repressor/biotin-[acetyl-CoA-carboxylase] ligase